MDFDEIPEADEQQTVIVEPVFEEVPPIPPPAPVDSFLPDPDPVEEDALTIFNREWAKRLDAKREQEFQHEKAAREKAQEELANWKSQREVRLSAKKDKNRAEEAVTVETLDSEAGNFKPWDRVPKLIDSNEVAPSEGTKDVSRMRKLFIHLKNEPLESTRAASAI
mmetsp:Transcript_24953/g.18846  ORF Transcript_24953/g.18846 Transcript_24953/m.18846 type:complete len:166 (+) Transcript_24953:56-553(+)|eukprot:CAMPEP_0202971800 /NCGR_PEP_ID=MMETSP1396-20130829/30926_1 /ASSEMBLY_ACC=CAM_ASM_000872 /TAXON_ID= /ORGANISM="Pseudokeronopsis sp., Strain Brazil" /LENGTH=165 /DNA_ID=CAMNT_0049701573 /DNA_START=48 /DNA_END=545 /DNA_ORIENTATION=+